MNLLADLRRDGYVQPFFEPELGADLRHRLYDSSSFTGHVIPQGDRVGRVFWEALEMQPTPDMSKAESGPLGFVCHRMSDVLAVPGLFDLIASVHGFASGYFGEDANLYSVNAFWKKPAGAPGWHHDADDGPKQLVMFMYGTDVLTADDGVHAYVTGSHLWPRAKLKSHHNVQEDVSGPLPADWPVHRFYGPAGTTFLTDTCGLHNGFAPTSEPRLLLWARWCAGPPPAAYKNDEIRPVPWRGVVPIKPSAEVQRRTRLVVDWRD